MVLKAGTRLGPYEIVSALGAGGMGEVYRAHDGRLDRDVAIKVLPAELASDPSRLKRFEKEARAASALNHPNIVTVHETGREGSTDFLVMELVVGRTLREVLSTGPLPIKRLLAIAAQIADGLARAHEAGIVHRDLKPENVMLTKDGLVKILDFGLARTTSSSSGSDEASHLATETGTSPGVILGTVGYMSPEQAVGHPLDFRSDQFALGSILYEMATGRRAFQKGTAVDTLSAILHQEPKPVAEINPEAPAPLRWIVERCLAKVPDERYGTTRDLARELHTVRDHLSETTPSGPGIRRPFVGGRRRRVAIGLAIAFVVVAAAAAWAGRQSVRVSMPTYEQLTFRHGFIALARFAPDGTVVYGTSTEGFHLELFSVRAGNPEPRSLGLPSANILSISQAGEMALIFSPPAVFVGTLATAPLTGGTPRELVTDVRGADWAPDGRSLAVVRRVSGKNRLEFPIGKLLAESEGLMTSPRVSRDGAFVAYDDNTVLTVVDSAGHGRVKLLPLNGCCDFAWSPSGQELWATVEGERGIRAVTRKGRQRQLLSMPGIFSLQDVSTDGRVLLKRETESGELWGLAPGESQERDLSWLDNSAALDLSADGRTILFAEIGSAGGSNGAVYKRDIDGSPAVRLGEGKGGALSPDGKWALSMFKADEQLELLPTGPGQALRIERGPIATYRAFGWYPDSRHIWFNGIEPGQPVRCYVQDIEGGKPRVVLPEGWRGRGVSPDGKQFAAARRGTDVPAFFLLEGSDRTARSIPGVVAGDDFLRWSADSRSLFLFQQTDGAHEARIFRVDLSNGRRELVKEISPTGRRGGGGFISAVVSADGKSWVYSYSRYFSDLFIVNGLR